jgi:PAS domain S-box-containing protein
MTLRSKLFLAQLPLLAALVFLSGLALVTVSSIGGSAQSIIRENYRSVVAAQRMKEAIERMDSGALFVIAAQREKGLAQAGLNRQRFESELRLQEANLTEPGEAETTRKLRRLWEVYAHHYDAFMQAGSALEARTLYFSGLEPGFVAVKDAADEILVLNQDAMARKSDRTQRKGQHLREAAAIAALGSLLAALLASAMLTARILKPLSRLSQVAHRIGEGDLDARAQVEGHDELARLAADFNAMANHLKRYRHSSLGELLAAQHAAQSAIDSIPDPVVIFNTEGRIVNINRAAESMLGAELSPDVEEPLGLVPPPVREVLQRLRAHVLSGKGGYAPRDFSEAVSIKAADGERYLLPRATPVYGEQGGVQGATIILQDVTRLRRFDELKNDLVATVAHEFRTPLTSLRMAVHLCLEGVVGPLGEKQADLLQAAREDCERLQSIIDDLLDLARLSAGRVEMRKVALSVQNLVEGSIAELRSIAEQRQVSLSAELSPLSPDKIVADPERLGLVFANLISNAIRHTPAGGSVTVRALETKSGAAIRFEVRDTGEGIPVEYQREIFHKFFRVPGSAGGAAGLGLSIAKEIVEAHSGEIGVDSQPAAGSTFHFTIPIADS